MDRGLMAGTKKSPESVGLAAAGETGRIKGSLTVDGRSKDNQSSLTTIC